LDDTVAEPATAKAPSRSQIFGLNIDAPHFASMLQYKSHTNVDHSSAVFWNFSKVSLLLIRTIKGLIGDLRQE
jgi:hypothetical protein